MPTLLDYDSSDDENHQTVTETALNWVRQELGTFASNDDTFDDTSVNLESLLKSTPTTCNKSRRPISDNNNSVSMNSSLSRTLTEEEILAQQQAARLLHQSPTIEHTSAAKRPIYGSSQTTQGNESSIEPLPNRVPRKMGPNEKYYNENCRSYVNDSISKFNVEHPNVLVNYHQLSESQKQAQQERVMKLLDRLKLLQKENVAQLGSTAPNGTVLNRSDLSDSTNTSKSLNLLSPSLNETNTTAGNDPSMNLLSPSKNHERSINLLATPDKNSQTLFSPMKINDYNEDLPIDEDGSLDSSTQSVEVARAAPRYESPPLSPFSKKRAATSSGKKGADTSRVRFDNTPTNILKSAHSSPSKSLADSIGRLSLYDDKIFASSQSPILHPNSDSPIRDDSLSSHSMHPDISFGGDDDEEESIKDSIVETAMMPDKTVRWDFDNKLSKEAPTHVKLLDGETLHYKSLKTAKRKPKLTQTFPDPLQYYEDREQRRMKRLYKWLLQRDTSYLETKTPGRSIVLSIQQVHLVDLILKLHLEYPRKDNDLEEADGDEMVGNTLVVSRTKEELELWSQGFREGSADSVLDHASLPLKDRKSATGAKHSTKYDIVLTTYDALKSPDVTVTLNDEGHVLFKPGKSDGWYSAQSQIEGEQNQQLSYLHCVHWRRVIFIDIVGRKSYLAKNGTARVGAAKALDSNARHAFFVVADETEKTGVKALVKSDRSSMASLASVLRVTTGEIDNEYVLEEDIVDFRDKATYLAWKQQAREDEDVR